MITTGELAAIKQEAQEALDGHRVVGPEMLLRTVLRFCTELQEAIRHEPDVLTGAPSGAHPRFWTLTEQMREIHIKKARDYGELGPDGTNHLANMKRSLAMGISPATAAMIRMSDKWSRVQTLYARRLRDGSGPAVADESLSDTLVDLASYALLALILMEEEGKE